MSTTSMRKFQKAKCPECRSDLDVPDTYSHGDQLSCKTCDLGLRVLRKSGLRLVIADPAPLRDTLLATRQRLRALESDLSEAQGSFGVGVNGLGIGLVWVVYQVGAENAMLEESLAVQFISISIVSGVLLEIANFLFLAKRQKMLRITADIEDTREEIKALERKIRDASAKA